ncbi:unnamed protein product [Calypogeia fissa]
MVELPDSFADVARVTHSHVPTANTPSQIEIGDRPSVIAAPRMKRGRPPGSADKHPRQRRPTLTSPAAPIQLVPTAPVNTAYTENEEIAIHYGTTGQIWDRTAQPLHDQFVFQIAQDVLDNLPDPKSIAEAQRQPDWPDWEIAINSELDSLISRQVFGPITVVPPDTHLTGYKWTFVKKRDAQGVIVRYKARLLAKGFTQIPERDYGLTYSPVMDIITYRYLIAFAQFHGLSMHQMDIVTAYLYGHLD